MLYTIPYRYKPDKYTRCAVRQRPCARDMVTVARCTYSTMYMYMHAQYHVKTLKDFDSSLFIPFLQSVVFDSHVLFVVDIPYSYNSQQRVSNTIITIPK